jgi:hypothetical protein
MRFGGMPCFFGRRISKRLAAFTCQGSSQMRMGFLHLALIRIQV